MKKITFGGIRTAAVEISNSADEQRDVEITAVANMEHGKIISIEDGKITKDGTPVADFQSYPHNNQVNASIYVCDPIGTPAVMAAIMDFTASVMEANEQEEATPAEP